MMMNWPNFPISGPDPSRAGPAGRNPVRGAYIPILVVSIGCGVDRGPPSCWSVHDATSITHKTSIILR